MAVCYTSEASVDSEQEVSPSCLKSNYSSIRPPIGSEINPFSDRCWLAADFKPSLRLLALEGATIPKRKENNPPLLINAKGYKIKQNKN